MDRNCADYENQPLGLVLATRRKGSPSDAAESTATHRSVFPRVHGTADVSRPSARALAEVVTTSSDHAGRGLSRPAIPGPSLAADLVRAIVVSVTITAASDWLMHTCWVLTY
jgi:hypothetical protein